jgi:hypothetical protein
MKKTVVFFLLFIFTLQCTKSLWIITTFHINRDYIAKNICINRFDKIPTCKGQCFLDNQLNKQEKENKKNNITIEKDFAFIYPQVDEVQIPSFSTANVKKVFSFYHSTHANIFAFKFENPPELV